MVAPDALNAGLAVTIDVVLRAEDAFRFGDGRVDVESVPVAAELDTVQVDPVVESEPRMHNIEGSLRRTEGLGDLSRRPVLAVVRGPGIGDVQEVCVEVVQVRLNEAEFEGKESVGISTAVK